MAAFDIIARITRLTPANITIREQVRLASNPLDLRWTALAPRVPTSSLKITSLEKSGLRLTAEYRAWNANGRELFEQVGPMEEWEILPLTAKRTFDEKRLLELSLPDPRIQDLVTNGVVADVDEWSTRIADAVHRRLEAAFFLGWLGNSFTVMDPVSGAVITTSLNIDATRYVAAGAAWTGAVYPTGTAFPGFVSAVRQAEIKFGVQPDVARMRQSTADLIVSSAPPGAYGADVTAATLGGRLNDRGIGTRIVIDERNYDKSTDGGTSTTPTYYVPTGKIGFQPPGGRIGNTYSIAASRGGKEVSGDRRVNLQDVTLFYTPVNRGLGFVLEGENIAVPMPETQRTFVFDALA